MAQCSRVVSTFWSACKGDLLFIPVVLIESVLTAAVSSHNFWACEESVLHLRLRALSCELAAFAPESCNFCLQWRPGLMSKVIQINLPGVGRRDHAPPLALAGPTPQDQAENCPPTSVSADSFDRHGTPRSTPLFDNELRSRCSSRVICAICAHHHSSTLIQ